MHELNKKSVIKQKTDVHSMSMDKSEREREIERDLGMPFET